MQISLLSMQNSPATLMHCSVWQQLSGLKRGVRKVNAVIQYDGGNKQHELA